jgi:hypothetical protein
MKYGGVIRTYVNLKIYSGGVGNKQMLATDIRNDLPTLNQMHALGATGFARAQPLRQQGGIAQALIELRDFPQMPLSMVRNGMPFIRNGDPGQYWSQAHDVVRLMKDVGHQYLNFQFGWVAFVNDLKKSLKTVLDQEKNLKRILHNNGRIIHCQSIVAKDDPKVTSVTSSNFNIGYPAVEGEFVDQYGKLKTSISVNAGSRFSGAFKYFLEGYKHGEPMTPRLKKKLLHILYGVDTSPNTIWATLPWSWLIDWGTNARDNVANFTALHQDGLVMVYGYVNDYKETITKYTLSGAIIGGRAIRCEQTDVNRYFTRTPGTPYGFGLTRSSFNAKQGSIIAALGLSNLQPQQFR